MRTTAKAVKPRESFVRRWLAPADRLAEAIYGLLILMTFTMAFQATTNGEAVVPVLVEHCRLTTPAQYRRMAALGMTANLFPNHIYFWGDQHRDLACPAEPLERSEQTRSGRASLVSS